MNSSNNQNNNNRSLDIEVDLENEHVKAIIKGRTGVPFKTLVKLILQRKVTTVFEKWGQNDVIINSELLTDLASAPQDNQETSRHLVLVTFGAGIFIGLFLSIIALLAVTLIGYQVLAMNLIYMLASMIAVIAIGLVLIKAKQRNKSDTLYDTMEKIASIVPNK